MLQVSPRRSWQSQQYFSMGITVSSGCRRAGGKAMTALTPHGIMLSSRVFSCHSGLSVPGAECDAVDHGMAVVTGLLCQARGIVTIDLKRIGGLTERLCHAKSAQGLCSSEVRTRRPSNGDANPNRHRISGRTQHFPTASTTKIPRPRPRSPKTTAKSASKPREDLGIAYRPPAKPPPRGSHLSRCKSRVWLRATLG